MNDVLNWLGGIFNSIPLTLLEVWGRFGFLVGFSLMLAAFARITFRPAYQWGLGRERQTWNTKALLSIIITFLLIELTGYLGSFIVLVPGAQTFESLKDLSVFICILLFGFPALIIVPFAYGLSDLNEGVAPGFILDWIWGYFINPVCFWIAYQLIGKNPDFKKLKTWKWYFLFVVIFMFIEPVLWGYICSNKFTSEISYRTITPALFFTTGITWIIAPFAMMIALPFARKMGFFWAEIPGHVKEHLIGQKVWIWESGTDKNYKDLGELKKGIPIRIFLVGPFIALIITLLGTTAYFTLSSSELAATKLAERLHLEITENINHQLDKFLESKQVSKKEDVTLAISDLLYKLPVAKNGRAFIIDKSGNLIASSSDNDSDLVAKNAVKKLFELNGKLDLLNNSTQFRFDVVTAKPLSRETWLTQATPYHDKNGGHYDWILMTAMPESYYLSGVRVGNSQSAMIFAIGLILSLAAAAALAAIVTKPIIKIVKVTQALARGDFSVHVPDSRLEEINTLSHSFNNMSEQLQSSFAMIQENEKRLQLAIEGASLGIWDWDIVSNKLVWDESMYLQYGLKKENFGGAYEAWERSILPEDIPKARSGVQTAMDGGKDYTSEFRILRPDGLIRHLKATAKLIRGEDGALLRMVGISFDISEQKEANAELMKYKNQLEDIVAERTAALEFSNKELESFSYSVSHDLRAPLRGIDGWSLALLEDYGHLLDEKANSYLNRVRSETQRMGELIDDLLKLSQISRSEMKWEKVDLTSIANTVIKRLTEQNPNRKLLFKVQSDLVTTANNHYMEIVLTNLLNNAAKFTSKVPEAIIEVGKLNTDNKVIYFVKDNGAGFNMNSAKNLFGAFQRMHKQSDFPGTGVGLAMVQRIITLHHGKIWAEAEINTGATFYFTINENE